MSECPQWVAYEYRTSLAQRLGACRTAGFPGVHKRSGSWSSAPAGSRRAKRAGLLVADPRRTGPCSVSYQVLQWLCFLTQVLQWLSALLSVLLMLSIRL